MQKKIDELDRRRAEIVAGGGEKRIAAQHKRGKRTARERIEMLLDEGSFVELNPFVQHRMTAFGMDNESAPGEGVVTGSGKIDGRLVYLFAQDFTVFGGALGEMHAMKIARIMDLAAQNGAPIIGLNDSGGARIQEGVLSLDGYGHVFRRNVLYSGVVPQISVILGPCAGGAVYSPALTDFVFMVEQKSQMFITGPKVIETVTKEKITAEELGGANIHASLSGNVHFTSPSETEVFENVSRLLKYLPQNNTELPPEQMVTEQDDWIEDLINVVPTEGMKAYDVKKVIERIFDNGDFLEVHQKFARNLVVGFAHLNGKSVGVVANQPKFMAGGLDIDASDKLSRFVRFCDCFQIPLITFVDVTGFFPGVSQEHRGIIRHGAKILYAYTEATVPKITVILRKAYGGAYVALNSKSIGADIVYAWPSAEVAVMGPEGAANIIFQREIDQSNTPEEMRKAKISEYKDQFANPYVAAAYGMVDDVIDPRETRLKLKQSLEMLEHKQVDMPRKKHGNIPL
ncbi:acyl-CoA carboxylase subunit beta [Shimazuella alba]|uniref:Methylmalonyl-CoA carboxyltransferase n=1 Tax=Shimazuella alba TaxID=2690964 RepID=A0A6I4VYH1_9BACL|nr:acyl-CoA carboxylase subunit beta [Shimazuella alba]MXQ55811.1 methylmalonyl-CoA carboxyltransferase [Shimazuella alba]